MSQLVTETPASIVIDPLDELSEEERRIAGLTLDYLGPDPFLWAIVTGTHQYGFTSPDSDIDVRGMFLGPTRAHLGLQPPESAHREFFDVLEGREVDCLAFEAGRFLQLILKHSGNLLEEMFSPLVVYDSGRLDDFRDAVRNCLNRGFARHYKGFFEACLKKLRKRQPPEIKSALYACRIALTGITLLTEGEVQAHLPTLNQRFGLDYVDEWIDLKVTEHEPVPEGRLDEIFDRLHQLRRELHRAAGRSILPDEPEGLEALDELLIDVRLNRLTDR